MKFHVKIYILVALASFAVTSCKEDTKTKAQKVSTIEFSIPNAEEEVKEKYESGVHKSSIYYNKETKEKVAEVNFHENGQPYTNRKFEKGVMNGESWSYYKDGKPWSLNTFKNGVYHGKYKTWHDNGQLNIDGQYVDGKEDGDWLTFYPGGQINTRGLYSMGEKVGLWASYNPDGTLNKEQDFSKN